MTEKQALQVLSDHNKWRRDNNVPSIYPMVDNKELGKALDLAIKHLGKNSQTLYTIEQAYPFLEQDAKEITIKGKGLLYTESCNHVGLQCNSNQEEIKSKCVQVSDLIREIHELNK